MTRDKTRDPRPLERYRGEISRCVRCGACSTVCPSFLADRRESRSPRGRIALIEAVLDGRLRASQVYQDRLATCTGCLACEARCASGVPAADIILAAKEQAFRETGPGLIAGTVAASLRRPLLMRSLAWLAPVVLHYQGGDMRGTDARGKRVRSERTAKGKAAQRVVFFPGCAVRYFQQDIGEAVAALLERIGYDVIVPDGLQCCGRPFLSLGDRSAAEAAARDNAALLAAEDAEAIVTACASCGLTFKRDYPGLLAPSGLPAPQVLDIHEFLEDKMDRLEPAPLPGRVTVHDPCHLGRGQKLAGTMRALLRKVPGLDVAEMQEPERCCGFGGVMRATHPESSTAIGSAKARDIIGTGAPLVVTGCPGCRMQISGAVRREGSDAQVVHTVQVIERAVRRQGSGVRGEERNTTGAGAKGPVSGK